MAGSQVRKLANWQGRKVGLALSGGAARGLAHIGVLEVLQKEGIPINMIAGSSAGAAIGAIYAWAEDASLIRKLVLGLDWKASASLVDFALPRTGLIKGKKIAAFLRKVVGGDIQFAELRIPLACVATDIRSCEEVVIREGSVLEAIRASYSVPGIFTLVKRGGRYLVDGALVNPVPVSVVKGMGADFVIAVSVVSSEMPEKPQQTGERGAKELRTPNIFNVIMDSLQIASCLLVKSCLEGADLVIKPRVSHIRFTDFRRARECILQGEIAAKDCIPEIRRRLETGEAG